MQEVVEFQSACFRSFGPEVNSRSGACAEDGDPTPQLPEARKGRHKSWRTFGARVFNCRIHPALTDGATN